MNRLGLPLLAIALLGIVAIWGFEVLEWIEERWLGKQVKVRVFEGKANL